jgi:hypothetical protein
MKTLGLLLIALFSIGGCAWLNAPAFPPDDPPGTSLPGWNSWEGTNPPRTIYVIRGRIPDNNN